MPYTYFAPASDIGAISRYQLQDEAQRQAAEASRQQFMADLYRTNADRYRAQQDAAARMFQTQAYRDVGMTDADVRRALGLGQIATQEKQLATQERIAGMPYEKMTPAQQRQFELQSQELELYRNNPFLLNPNQRVQEDIWRQQNLSDLVARAADTANANLERRGGMAGIKAELAKTMDAYGHWFSPISGQGLTKSDSQTMAELLTSGGAIPPDYATRDVIGAGRKYFNDILDSTTAGLEDFKPYLRFDIRSGKWKSSFEGQRTPATQPPGVGAGAYMAVPPPVTNALTAPVAKPAPRPGVVTIQPRETMPNLPRMNLTNPDRIYLPQRGGVFTNAVPQY